MFESLLKRPDAYYRRRLEGKRVLITGAARGLGASLAKRLAGHGAKLVLVGLEKERLEETAGQCGGALFFELDVRDLLSLSAAVNEAVAELGGLDVVVANAGVAVQLPLVGGDPETMRKVMEVNFLGTYNTVLATGEHLKHEGAYALLISSLAAAIHLPLMGAYSASKAAVEALGNTLRVELGAYGAKVGVAYFSEIDTEMTKRGFGTRAARALVSSGHAARPAPIALAVNAMLNGIADRRARVVAPFWVELALRMRFSHQLIVTRLPKERLRKALSIAVEEHPDLTTPLPNS